MSQIKPEELRIRNYVYPDSITDEFIRITPKDFEDTSHLEPIPLSEEILLKCGFEKKIMRVRRLPKTNALSFKKGLITLHFIGGILSSVYIGIQRIDDGNNFYSLHQLQNLYYSLTRKELKIEL